MTGVSRNHTLDGLRGCLALLVLADHVLLGTGSTALEDVARGAVWMFFAISGYVLTRAWDGRYLHFLIRRVVRLWPVYAVCLGAGYALMWDRPSYAQFLWLAGAVTKPEADIPAWSLVIEIWAMPFMPLFVWVARRSHWWLLASLFGAGLCAYYLNALAFYGIFFFIGAWLSRLDFRIPLLETPFAQFLGRISYPLYLCHYPIIHYLGLPIIVDIPLSIVVALVLTETVERWSIRISRRVSKAERSFGGVLQAS
jgi:peptidoglycan/LPS O-acetylase OafA/YrhL